MKVDFPSILDRIICVKSFSAVLMMVLGGIFLMSVVPPLKSPDEHEHLKRAYLLGQGVFFLSAPLGKSSGGYIDSGLLRYLNSYNPAQPKLTAEDVSTSDRIRWSGEQVFETTPGTGYYFPLVYLPQAIALRAGQLLDLSVNDSYKLARVFSLVSVALIIYSGLLIYPPNPLVLALLIMPMTLFQISSATIDGLANALAVFSVSCFLRIMQRDLSSLRAILIAMAISIALLASSRIHATPMICFFLAAYYTTRARMTLVLFVIVSVLVVAWTTFVLYTLVDGRVFLGESTSNIIRYYATTPTRFFLLIWETLSSDQWRDFYYKSFVGILGWLDVALDAHVYDLLGSCLIVTAILSFSLSELRRQWIERSVLVAVSISCVMLIFFAMLVTWTPHPAQVILGVQGRYFTIPALLVAYSIGGGSRYVSNLRATAANFIVLVVLLVSMFSTVDAILKRYYFVEFYIDREDIVFHPAFGNNSTKFVASPALTKDDPISLRIPTLAGLDVGKVRRVEILFGTHMRVNQGEAELVLRGNLNEYRTSFRLPELKDNSYMAFSVPLGFYTSGEIRFVSGGGVSVWEIHSAGHEVFSCVKVRTAQNQLVSIAGCP